MLVEKTFKEMLDEIASSKPAPGGGSVAAISGVLSSALDCMVCSLTIGKKKYADVEEEMKSYLEKSEKTRKRLTELIEEDTEAFNKVMEAYKLPRENTNREKTIEETLKYATKVPFEVAQESYKALEIAAILVEKGNRNAVTDAGVAAELSMTAIRSAIYNVLINLDNIKDEEFKNEYGEKCAQLLEDALLKNDLVTEYIFANAFKNLI